MTFRVLNTAQWISGRNETDNSSSDGFHDHFPIEKWPDPEYIILHLKTHRDWSGLVVFTVVAYPPKSLADGSTDVRPQATGISVTWILCVWIIGTAKSEDVGIFGTYLKMWYFGSPVWPLPLSHGFFRIPMDDSWSHGGKSTKLDEGFNGRIISCGIFEHTMITSDQIQDSSPGLVTPEGCAGKRPLHHCLREYRCCHMIHQVHHDSTIKPTDFASFCHHFSSFWWENIFKTWSKHSHSSGGWSIHLGSGDQRGDAFAKTLGRFSTFQQGFVWGIFDIW